MQKVKGCHKAVSFFNCEGSISQYFKKTYFCIEKNNNFDTQTRKFLNKQNIQTMK